MNHAGRQAVVGPSEHEGVVSDTATMTSDDPLALRNRPVQQRGIARFEAILGAARVVLAERGYEHFTVEDVAAQAGVPVGSVYQYFPHKYALVAELAAQDTEFLVVAIDEVLPSFPSEDWQHLVDDLIEALAFLWSSDPSRPVVWAAMRSTAATRKRAAENTASIARAAAGLLAPLTEHLTDDQRFTVAQVTVETCQSLLNLSMASDALDREVVAELKRLVRAYLRSVALAQH